MGVREAPIGILLIDSESIEVGRLFFEEGSATTIELVEPETGNIVNSYKLRPVTQ